MAAVNARNAGEVDPDDLAVLLRNVEGEGEGGLFDLLPPGFEVGEHFVDPVPVVFGIREISGEIFIGRREVLVQFGKILAVPGIGEQISEEAVELFPAEVQSDILHGDPAVQFRGDLSRALFEFRVFFDEGEFGMSKWIIGVIIAAIITIVGLVFSILSIERGTGFANISKITKIALIVAAVGLFWAIVPNATICGYNCVLND